MTNDQIRSSIGLGFFIGGVADFCSFLLMLIPKVPVGQFAIIALSFLAIIGPLAILISFLSYRMQPAGPKKTIALRALVASLAYTVVLFPLVAATFIGGSISSVTL